MKRLIIVIIRIYQHTVSPDHGLFKARYPYGFCKFYPSCSMYAIMSIEKLGILAGSIASIKRIIRCNPFSAPRVDAPFKNLS